MNLKKNPYNHGHLEAEARFVFFGTPKVASETLATLRTHDYVPALVVTAPDAPVGRGLTLTPSPVKTLAYEHTLPTITPKQLDQETIENIRSYACDYAIVVAYGKIFPELLINAFPKGVLNVHYSLLPKYRGASPLEAALLSGDSHTGVTIQKMALALDAGDILTQEAIEIAPSETARELRPRLIRAGADLLVATLPRYLAGHVVPVSQDSRHASYAHKLKKADGCLALDGPARDNWNKYRAFADSIGTYFLRDDTRVKILRASYTRGAFVVERVVPEGKREMDFADYMRAR